MRLISGAAWPGERPNFEPSWPVSTCACVSAVTPGMIRTSTSWACPRGTVASSRSTSSLLSTTTSPMPCSTAIAISSSLFALPCSTIRAGVDAGLERGEDLAATGHVEAEALLDHHPLDGGAREGLGREHHPGVRPSGRQLVGVLTGPGPQRLLGHDEDRGAELLGEVVGPAAADDDGRRPRRACCRDGNSESRSAIGRVYSVRARTSRTRSMLVPGCRNANRPTVSPSHLLGGMNATLSSCSCSAQRS